MVEEMAIGSEKFTPLGKYKTTTSRDPHKECLCPEP